ncbi:hypothetical protein ACLQ2N_22485 [Streptomyces sp. DT224]|uniref:hypothetical protein n=1 Tax=Streptomyces sp. DT224 TaxID=3393426 RepID=UPI003CF7E1CF
MQPTCPSAWWAPSWWLPAPPAPCTVGTLCPVLVAFLGDPDAVAGVMRRTGIRVVQFHACRPPASVRALRTVLPESVIVKVLHVSDGTCPQRPLVGA